MPISYPNQYQNYCIFDVNVSKRAEQGEKQLPIIKAELKNPKDEAQVIEDLYILNLMLDNGINKQKLMRFTLNYQDIMIQNHLIYKHF